MIDVDSVSKQFTLHLREGVVLPVIRNASFTVSRGECAVLDGDSGSGKSSLLKMVYGNYHTTGGEIRICHDGQWVNLVSAGPRTVLAVRKRTLGYVSQFLRAVPRVAALDIVAEPLLGQGIDAGLARERAAALLERLNLPAALWALPPATFSGGEQQRVNIARGFISPYPALLLDEPTASLDVRNGEVVMELIREKKQAGTALLAICHDAPVRDAIADSVVDVRAFAGS